MTVAGSDNYQAFPASKQPRLSDSVRQNAAQIRSQARHVRIDHSELFSLKPQLVQQFDDERHFKGATREETAAYVFALNAINFGSGWFPTLNKRDDCSGYWTIAWNLADHFRTSGVWNNHALITVSAAQLSTILRQPLGHPLMSLYAESLRALGRWQGSNSFCQIIDSQSSGDALSKSVTQAMPFYRDHGFYKRSQILVSDLEHFGIWNAPDLDSLTIFADNLVPHVLKVCGALRYSNELQGQIDNGKLFAVGGVESEIRGCAVHAVELLSRETRVAPRLIDSWLWNMGAEKQFKATPRHRCRTVFY